ncbi:hypothetical protein [Paramicrobacterium humi]|uniref:hypothetical protein n=1 Tax=Paramicrobacterium humi TaxID=640635 RepID=UPI00115FF7A9|nr:hypothetical protein [Microbacterium humi]
MIDLEDGSAAVIIKLGAIEFSIKGDALRGAGLKPGVTSFSDVVVRQRPSRPTNTVDLSTDDRDYYDAMGPWVRGSVVADRFGKHLETINGWRKTNKLLGVGFGRDKVTYFYPVQQFRDGNIIPHLKDVLDALANGFVSEEARAAWLADRAYEEGESTRWDVLRDGDADLVLAWAQEDAARLGAA